MKKRLDGEGSISWANDRQRYVVAVTVDGRRVKQTTRTEDEAVRVLQELRRKYGLIKYSGNMSLEDWYEEWLFEVKIHSLRPRSVADHKGILDNHIRPYPIAKMSIGAIDKMDVTKYFNSLAKDGRSRQTIEKIKARLTTCFNEAEDYVEKNPVKGANVPNADDRSRKYSIDPDEIAVLQENVFTKEQQNTLIANLGDNWTCDFLIHFILGTGLRIGEALALTRFDYDGANIMVRKSLQREPVYVDRELDHYDLVMADVKTANSVRSIPLPAKMKAGLDERIDQIKNMKQPYKDQGLLFPDEIGSHMDDKRPLRRLRRLEKQLGLPAVTVHGLRHSYATRLLELGKPIQTISKLLGHSSIELTQGVYAHVLETMKTDAVDLLNSIL